MDLRMPVMGGYEATERIRALSGGKETIIIALSASSLENERTTALSGGCDDFLRKPFHEADIFERMQKHLGVRFVYENRLHPPAETLKTLAGEGEMRTALAALPPELLNQLEKYAVSADMDAFPRVISDIRFYDLPLANTLTQLSDEFEYGKILSAAEECIQKQKIGQ